MRLVSLTCPGCCAQMLVDRANHRAYCEYCGTVLLLDDDSVNAFSSGSLSEAPDLSANNPDTTFETEEERAAREERERKEREEQEERMRIAKRARELELQYGAQNSSSRPGSESDPIDSGFELIDGIYYSLGCIFGKKDDES